MAEHNPSSFKPNLNDMLLDIATNVCQTELEIRTTPALLKVFGPRLHIEQWLGGQDRTIFPSRLLLSRVIVVQNDVGELELQRATIGLHDEGMHLDIAQDRYIRVDDPFARPIYDTFVERYTGHPHHLCIPQLVKQQPPVEGKYY